MHNNLGIMTPQRKTSIRWLFLVLLSYGSQAWVPPSSSAISRRLSSSALPATWFATETSKATSSVLSLEKQKAALLQLGAAMDRGQAYNPTSGEYVSD
jgi:hypothetical protein